MKLLLWILFSIFFICQGFSQDCEVLTASIKGKYSGACKNKKAEGMGKAEGIDSYEGNFKSGYPSGQGAYTYKNGDFFRGTFKKGIKEGKGEFHYKKQGTDDSIVAGFWKDDIYIGAYLRPYEIEKQSSGFSRLDVRQDVGLPNTLTIVSQNVIKSNSLGNNAPPALPVISFINVDKGSYAREERSNTDKTSTLILYDLKFPFHIQANYGQESFELLINKEGTWHILAQISMREN